MHRTGTAREASATRVQCWRPALRKALVQPRQFMPALLPLLRAGVAFGSLSLLVRAMDWVVCDGLLPLYVAQTTLLAEHMKP